MSRNGKDTTEERQSQPAVGILLGDAFDDWLDELGISLDAFANQMMGSWVFNYIQALQTVGVRPVLFCVSMHVTVTTRFTHRPTGATIVVMPPSRLCQIVRRCLPIHHDGYVLPGYRNRLINRAQKAIVFAIKSYLATPLIVLFRELRREACRSLLVQEFESARFDVCVLFGRLKHMPVFGTFTGGYQQRWWMRSLRSLALQACAGLAICSAREVERVMTTYDLTSKKVTQIYYPVNFAIWHPEEKEKVRASLGIPLGAQVAMYHGAIELKVKGLDVLVEAWEQICRDRPELDLRLILIGTGNDSPTLSRLIATKRLRGVEWLNQWVHDRGLIQRYLSSADIYVFPSRSDASPVALVEAMACGLPVVASDVRGIPDLLPQGEQSGGLLVPPGDVNALTRGVSRLLDDRALAHELGRRARRNAEMSFSMEAIGTQLSSFLLNGRQ